MLHKALTAFVRRSDDPGDGCGIRVMLKCQFAGRFRR